MKVDPSLEEELQHPHVYRVSQGLRLTGYAAALFFFIVGIGATDQTPKGMIEAALFVTIAIYAVGWVILARMTLSNIGIKISRPWPFESHQISHSEIAGRHWVNRGRVRCHVLVSDNGRRMFLDDTFATDHFFEKWVKSLPNLDPQDHESEAL